MKTPSQPASQPARQPDKFLYLSNRYLALGLRPWTILLSDLYCKTKTSCRIIGNLKVFRGHKKRSSKPAEELFAVSVFSRFREKCDLRHLQKIKQCLSNRQKSFVHYSACRLQVFYLWFYGICHSCTKKSISNFTMATAIDTYWFTRKEWAFTSSSFNVPYLNFSLL